MIQIDELIKDAMHQKNRELLNVLKLIKAEFLKKQTEPGRKTKELTEEEQIKVLLKMASQHEDSITQYKMVEEKTLLMWKWVNLKLLRHLFQNSQQMRNLPIMLLKSLKIIYQSKVVIFQ